MQTTRIRYLSPLLPVWAGTRARAAAAVLTLACVGALSGCGSSEPSTAAANSGEAMPVTRALPVQTARATVRPVSATVQATGGFAAEESSDIAPDSPGLVVATLADVGDFVRQGQLIARLDDRDPKLRLDQALAQQQQAEAAVRQAQSRIGLGTDQSFDPNLVPEVLAAQAAYESAQAQARLAEANAQRYSNLVDSGDVSRSTFDTARTTVETAQAQANAARQQYEATLNNARQNYQGVATQEASLAAIHAQVALARKSLEDTEIKAPFAGYISARPVAVGEYVATSTTVATIVRVTPIKLELQVPETYSSNVATGMMVDSEVPGYPDRTFRGRVDAVNPSVDPNSRTFIAEVEFANADRALKPGMFATARIELPGEDDGVFVPRQAIISDTTTNSSQVFMIVDGKARLAVVQLGAREGDQIRILSGIPSDALVAIDRLEDLYDGQDVEVTNPSAAQPAASSGRSSTPAAPQETPHA